MRHTPGPWTWGESDYPLEGELPVHRDLLKAPAGHVMRATYSDSGIEFSFEADARLIEVAPDLLTALEAIRDAEYDAGDGYGMRSAAAHIGTLRICKQLARDAIAKVGDGGTTTGEGT